MSTTPTECNPSASQRDSSLSLCPVCPVYVVAQLNKTPPVASIDYFCLMHHQINPPTPNIEKKTISWWVQEIEEQMDQLGQENILTRNASTISWVGASRRCNITLTSPTPWMSRVSRAGMVKECDNVFSGEVLR